jgi:flavin-dependent dehydrogenase
MEAEIDKQDFARQVEVPEVYYGVVKWGYGWVFPKKDHLTIGIAGLYRHNPDIKKAFTDFLENDLGLSSRITMKGFYLPFGSYSKQPGEGNILLVGDAAGLVDPITGEGIAFAMQSGQFAALSIAEAIKKNEPATAYRIYRKKLKKITRTIDHANYVKHLIYPEFSKRVLIKGLASSTDKHSIKYYMDLLADEISYPQYIGRLFRKSGKRIFRLIVS